MNMHKGDQIVCENGHVVCDVVKDVDTSIEPMPNEWAGIFGNWRGDAPTIGGRWPRCHECGGRVDFTNPLTTHE